MINPILSDKKNFCVLPQSSHIKSVEEIMDHSQVLSYGCLSKVSSVVNGKQVLWEVKKVLQCHFPVLNDKLNAMIRNNTCWNI